MANVWLLTVVLATASIVAANDQPPPGQIGGNAQTIVTVTEVEETSVRSANDCKDGDSSGGSSGDTSGSSGGQTGGQTESQTTNPPGQIGGQAGHTGDHTGGQGGGHAGGNGGFGGDNGDNGDERNCPVVDPDEFCPKPCKNCLDIDPAQPPPAISSRIDGGVCTTENATFDAACGSKYDGIRDGSRCFFATTDKITWEESWNKCCERGGILSHIHTSAELVKIAAFLRKKKVADRPWLAFRHNTRTVKKNFLDMENSIWRNESNPAVYDPALKAGNTWIRTHEKDNGFLNGHDCGDIHTDFKMFGDRPCAEKYQAICVVLNTCQAYHLVQNKCLLEAPIKEYKQYSAQKCADECTSVQWCRSFNYYTDRTCHLFTFVAEDTTNVGAVHTCYHYSYDP